MARRDRAFSAIIKESKIVMVHIIDGTKNFWTLPGGGVIEGESFEEAAIREVKEEVNLDVTIIRSLFNREYDVGTEYCFLTDLKNDSDLTLGYDPEYALEHQILVDASWRSIVEVKEDLHVSEVLKALTEREKNQYKINI